MPRSRSVDRKASFHLRINAVTTYRRRRPASEMTYAVSSGALNSTPANQSRRRQRQVIWGT